jgi:uncharacterized Ntn-hydrolase superfamily protein
MLAKYKEPGQLPIERIIKYLESDAENDADLKDQLSAKDREILDQINFVDDQIRQYNRTPKKVVAMMQKKFTNSNTGNPLSIDTCYRRIRQAQRVFGTIDKRSKDYWRGFLVDKLLTNMAKADAAGDIRGVNAAAAIMERVLQLGKDEQGLIPEDALERIEVVHVLDPRAAGLEVVDQDEIEKAYMKFTGEKPKNFIHLTEEVDYEDVTDEQ